MENITIKDILVATGGRLLSGFNDTRIENISLDSRKMLGNDLFVPVIGERVDAHNFIEQAFLNGAAVSFTSRKLDGHLLTIPGKAVIEVSDTIWALQRLGAYCRKRYQLPVIGVTGSVGKTSMREMIATALSASYKVFRTAGNLNSQVGLPITLSRITERDEIAVLELGMSQPGEMEKISQIAGLSMAVITNIGIAHLEQLGSRENICREKFKIQEGLLEGGKLFLNGDDDILKNRKANPGFGTIYYGTGANCDYRAVDIHEEHGFPAFTAVYKESPPHQGKSPSPAFGGKLRSAESKEEMVSVELNILGRHNVLNAMAALAVCRENGVPMEKAALALKEYTGFEGRQQIHRKNGMTIIDDSYNASPESMKAGIDVLNSLIVPGRKLLVLADMLELGEDSAGYHYEVGEYLAKKKVDELITVGLRAVEIARAVKENSPTIKVTVCQDNREATAYLKEVLKAEDACLFKGSNSMKLGTIVKSFL